MEFLHFLLLTNSSCHEFSPQEHSNIDTTNKHGFRHFRQRCFNSMSHESTSPNPIYIPLSIDDGPSFIHPVIHSLICMSQVMCEYLMRNHVDEKESFHSAARLMHRQAVARFVARLQQQQQHSYSTGQFSELIYLRHRLICNECVRN